MTDENQPRIGFVNFAETWNGRMAMMGILIGLGTELITGQSILRQIGIAKFYLTSSAFTSIVLSLGFLLNLLSPFESFSSPPQLVQVSLKPREIAPQLLHVLIFDL